MSKGFLSEVNEKNVEVNESFKKEKFESIKPDRTKRYGLFGLIIIALITGFIVLNPKVTVVNLVGMQISDAKIWGTNNDIQIIEKEVYSNNDEGIVINQSIDAQEKIDKNSTIIVEVSLGYNPNEEIGLPNFDSTWSKTKILNWLEENHITNYKLLFEEVENSEPNFYISHRLPDTTENYVRKDNIEFTLTSLIVEEEIIVVDMINYSTAQIDSWAKENKINIKYAYAFSSTVQENKVLSQSISSEEIINPNDTIIVTLSQGPAIKILNFTDTSDTDAIAWAKENNIDLSIYKEYSSTVNQNSLIWQDLAKDTVVKTGTDLKLYYSLGSQIYVASYVNQSLTNLQNYIETQNALKANLKLNVSYSYSSNVGINRVISQSSMDTRLNIGTTINVIVSLGDLSIVPDLLNGGIAYSSALEAYEKVLASCNNADLICKIIFVDNDEKIGVVDSQSIIAGTQVSDNTVIEVIIFD